MKHGIHEFGEATIEKISAAREKIKHFIGTKKDAEEHGHEIDNEYIV